MLISTSRKRIYVDSKQYKFCKGLSVHHENVYISRQQVSISCVITLKYARSSGSIDLSKKKKHEKKNVCHQFVMLNIKHSLAIYPSIIECTHMRLPQKDTCKMCLHHVRLKSWLFVKVTVKVDNVDDVVSDMTFSFHLKR